MSYGYGGGRANPYDQRGNNSQPYPQQYGGQQYGNAPAMGRDEYTGNNVELEPLTPNGGQFAVATQPDSRAILEECREIDRAVDEIEQSKFAILQTMQTSILNDPDPGTDAIKQLDKESAEIMGDYRYLVDRARKLKSKPGSSGNAQVGRIDRKVKMSLQKYQKMDVEYTKRLQEQMARQYRIVRPDASEQEVRDAVERPEGQQVFSQALMQSNRRGQAQSVMSAVQSRHDEIQKIERQMIELAELFQDMERLVVEQEAAVTNIEMKGEEVVENMDQGNKQLDTGIKSARNARKWKWWCLGISILIIIIIVVIILIVKFVVNGPSPAKTTNKRSLFSTVNHRVVSGQPWSPTTPERSVEVPGLKWTRDNNLAVLTQGRPVQPGVEWAPPSKKERRFQA